MIKRLVFAAALLVPCLAFGADPSADLSVKVVPPGSPPPGGAIAPAGAAAAGFTTLAFNADYTQGHPLDIGCTADGSDMTPHEWYQNGYTGGNNVVPPCSDINIIDDGGIRALQLTWDAKLRSKGFYGGNNIQTTNSNGSLVTGGGFPNAYFEATFRYKTTPDVPRAALGGLWTNFFTWSVCGPQTANKCPGILEMDVQENHGEFPGNTFAAWHFWGAGNTANSPYSLSPGSSFDPSQYHTYGARLTSDGSSRMVMCGYLDSVFKGCSPINATAAPAVFNNRSYLILSMGWGCKYSNGQGLCQNTPIGDVFQCPGGAAPQICIKFNNVGAYLQYPDNDPYATVSGVQGITAANGLWHVKPLNGTCCDVNWILEGSTWPGGSYAGGGTFNEYSKADMVVQSVRVWSCDQWQTDMCNGPVLSSAP